MRFLPIIFLLGLLIQQAPADTFKHDQGFSVEPASSWTVKDSDLPFGVLLTVRKPGEDPYGPSLQIGINRGVSSLKDYRERQEMMLEGTAEKLSHREVKVAGRPAGLLSYELNASLRTETYFVVHRDSVYTFSLTARLSDWESHGKALHGMLNSLELQD